MAVPEPCPTYENGGSRMGEPWPASAPWRDAPAAGAPGVLGAASWIRNSGTATPQMRMMGLRDPRNHRTHGLYQRAGSSREPSSTTMPPHANMNATPMHSENQKGMLGPSTGRYGARTKPDPLTP